MKAVTRFAPSPTGYIHIGNVRSAIYPYLVARQTGGKMILRIEDTDQARYVEGATELIEDTLKWLGLEWDEGPIVGGPNGPYFQTERRDIYIKWAKKLIEAGRAYADPTPTEEVEEHRKYCTEHKIPYLFRNFRPENPPAWEPGMTLRFKTEPKEYSWHDEVMGDMHTGPEVLDDIVLIKKDGLPTYNFAHIVDDAEMGVTHIMRGVEYLSSTPNYLAIYEALGLNVPKLVSLPHILAPTGNKKLGKRDGAKSVTEYRDDGILAEAMLNYLANLGWNDGTEQEIYTKEELIKAFSLDHVQTSGARYDETKLFWMNGQWIRRIATENGQSTEKQDNGADVATEKGINDLYTRTAGFWPESAASATDDYKKKVLAIVYDRLKVLSDLRTMTNYFFEEPEIDLEMINSNKFIKKINDAAENGEGKGIKELLGASIDKFDSITDWTADNLQSALNELLEETGKKPAELFSLLRIVVSFAPFSPALNLTFEVIGKEKILARLEKVTEKF